MVQEKKEIGQRQRYPALSLEEAIQKARTVFDHVQRSSASTEKVASYWKYGLKSSGWRLSLAALKQYGLLESVGSKKSGEVKLTDLALRIILDSREQSTERDQAIKEAALRPQIGRSSIELHATQTGVPGGCLKRPPGHRTALPKSQLSHQPLLNLPAWAVCAPRCDGHRGTCYSSHKPPP